MVINDKTLVIGFGLLVGAVVAYVVASGGVKEAAKSIAGSAVSAADGAAAGTVVGIGQAIGIPDTDAAKAAEARRNGDVWNASIYMPAADFIKWLLAGKPAY